MYWDWKSVVTLFKILWLSSIWKIHFTEPRSFISKWLLISDLEDSTNLRDLNPEFWKEITMALVNNQHNTETTRNGYPIKMYQGGPPHELFFIAIDCQGQVIIGPNKKIVVMHVLGELEILAWFMRTWILHLIISINTYKYTLVNYSSLVPQPNHDLMHLSVPFLQRLLKAVEGLPEPPNIFLRPILSWENLHIYLLLQVSIQKG